MVFCCQKLKNYGKKRTNGTEEGFVFGLKMGVDWAVNRDFPINPNPDKRHRDGAGSG